jgi:hypothetical protein
MGNQDISIVSGDVEQKIREELDRPLGSERQRRYRRFLLAAELSARTFWTFTRELSSQSRLPERRRGTVRDVFDSAVDTNEPRRKQERECSQ